MSSAGNDEGRAGAPPRALAQALALVSEAVFITDARGRITFVNGGFTALYGHAAADIVGRRAAELGPEAGPGSVPEAEFRGEVTHVREGGRHVAVALARAAVRDEAGTIVAHVHVARAGGPAQQLDDELRRAHDELAAQRAALRELAIRDELTGLYNHREMHRLIAEEVGRARRYRRPLALLLIDVDNLDGINAEHGDVLGDEVLRGVAGILRANLRPVDRPARYGGAELAVLLPDTFATDAVQVAERLRALTGQATFTAVVAGTIKRTARVTISVGVAGVHESDDGPDQLLRAADQALREAKGRGRDNVVAFVDLPAG